MREFFGEAFDPAQRTLAVSEATEEKWPAFLEWLIHDFRLATGQTPIARFLAERGKSLPAEERGILEEWQDALVGLHEVVDLEPERASRSGTFSTAGRSKSARCGAPSRRRDGIS